MQNFIENGIKTIRYSSTYVSFNTYKELNKYHIWKIF